MTILGRFVAIWADPGSGRRQSESGLSKVEAAFKVRLPAPYREFLKTYGNVSTQQLMTSDAIVDNSLDLLFVFFSAREILEETKSYRRGGLPPDLICIASGILGNPFCFRVPECNEREGRDAPVSLYMMDDQEEVLLAPTFVDWIASFLAGPKTKRK